MRALIFRSSLVIGLLSGGTAWAQYGQAPGPGQYGSQPATTQPPIESGGLAPPSSTPTETPEAAQTEEQLNEADKKDTGRGLEWIWLNAEVGFEHVGLQTFHANGIVDPGIVGTTQTGAVFGAGLGVRLIFITLGAKFRIAPLSAYDIWTLNAEAGLRIPLGHFEPYLTLGGGFASLGSFSASDIGGVSRNSVTINGYDIRAGGGLDYYVTPVFSVGAAVTFELLGLSRARVNDVTGNTNGAAGDVYLADGSSLGSAFTGTLVLGLHF